MTRIPALLFALALTACGGDRYDGDAHGSYGGGPLVHGGATNPAQTAATIRAADPAFEKDYAGGEPLDAFLQDYITNGHQTKARVRILKIRDVGGKLHAFVALTDAAGEPTTDATKLKFGQLNGVTGEKVPVGLNVIGPVYGRYPVQISAVLDHSGSMSGSIDALHGAAIQLIDALPEASFSVVKFAGAVDVVQPMTKDRAALAAAVNAPYELASTALFDAIVGGLATHGGSGAELEALTLGLVFTDGVENASKTGYEATKAALRGARVPQLMLGMGDVDMKSLITMAEDTNGLFQYLMDATKFEGAMTYAAATVKAIVEVELDAPAGLKAEDLTADLAP